ncbi:hypothetical protein [Streptomyces sp. NPDC058280]|uniref:hypothetical protein n=1 Tax=Streptomyces sp. NPDC058280 TaxID=3346419 RepID=UPI0036E633AD
MQHDVRFTRETRDLPPVDGWRRIEPTGYAHTSCSCGLDTGRVPDTEATSTARTHTAA